ncbi:MAG: TrmH family RNA methyltransferase [Patescibacteria group bacterium]
MTPKQKLIIILDNVRSMYNVGAIFRLAAGLNVDELYLCGMTATPPRAEIHKTALGGETKVKWTYFDNTSNAIKQCQDNGYEIVSLEITSDAIPLADFSPGPKTALIVGHEVDGVDRFALAESTKHIFIPMHRDVNSLNVSTACAIAVWCIINKKG